MVGCGGVEIPDANILASHDGRVLHVKNADSVTYQDITVTYTALNDEQQRKDFALEPGAIKDINMFYPNVHPGTIVYVSVSYSEKRIYGSPNWYFNEHMKLKILEEGSETVELHMHWWENRERYDAKFMN